LWGLEVDAISVGNIINHQVKVRKR
jgi:hypothetical protein